jgi:hypothetical protein
MVHIGSAGRRVVNDVVVQFGCGREERGIRFDIESRPCSSVGCLVSTIYEGQLVTPVVFLRPTDQSNGARHG